MTTRTEVLALLTNPESSGVEYKRDDITPQALAKELVALTNLDGGRVLLGVEDDGSVTGIARQDVEEWVMAACRSKIRPPIIPWFELVADIEPGRDIAVVRVDRGYAVHSVWHHDHHSYYVRVGSTSREASQEELARLFQRRGQMRAELQSITGSALSDLDLGRLAEYIGRVRDQEVPRDDEGWRQLLVNIELLTDDGAATLAGLLLFGRQPSRWLPQSGIDAVAYHDTVEDYAAIERETIRGPMTGSWDRAGHVIELGIIERAINFVARTAPTVTTLVDGRRVDAPALPEGPVREAVVNALVHRDWLLSGTTVQLSLFADRLEVVSPGRLPNGITPDMMRAGARSARNQLLRDVLRDYGYLESMGMGIPRKVIAGMRAFNGTTPDLEDEHERVTVRLWRGPGSG